MTRVLELDGTSLRLEDLRPIFAGEPVRLRVAEAARERVRRARELVERCVRSGEPVYGVTTGFGKLKSVAIPASDILELQRNLVLSHCCGVGDPMPAEEVRAVQVLRLNGLLRGHSGVTEGLVDHLVRLFDAGFVPWVPQQGSVGASGDLAPLAHVAAASIGHGRAWVGGELLAAAEALRRIGEAPVTLQAKEGLALINGTEVMKAVGAGAWLRAENLSKCADAITSLTIEALFGSVHPFDDRLARLKGHAGHARTASNVRRCLLDSQVVESHRGCDRVQDPYSLRCVPQVHGAFKTALAHVGEVLAAEMNSVTDNPILFPETGEVISAGQFHGQPISMALDYLALALCTLANVSERRTEQLVNPDLSHMPPFLTPRPGLHSGFMIAQVAAASLASENKCWAHPASVDTIPTSANQEDHVSMGVTAARKARAIARNVERVLALELLCAAQARDFHRELEAGRGAQAVHAALRARVEALDADRYLHDDIEEAVGLVGSGALVLAVEAEWPSPAPWRRRSRARGREGDCGAFGDAGPSNTLRWSVWRGERILRAERETHRPGRAALRRAAPLSVRAQRETVGERVRRKRVPPSSADERHAALGTPVAPERGGLSPTVSRCAHTDNGAARRRAALPGRWVSRSARRMRCARLRRLHGAGLGHSASRRGLGPRFFTYTRLP